jgi:hypothetical protein
MQYINAHRNYHLVEKQRWIEFVSNWATDIDYKGNIEETWEPEMQLDPTRMSAKILLSCFADGGMHRAIQPGLSTVFPSKRPKFASIDPVIIKLYNWKRGDRFRGECGLWFLGEGYIRLEMDTEPFTGKPGKLMWSGIQRYAPVYLSLNFRSMTVDVANADKKDEWSAEMHRKCLAHFGRSEPEESESESSGTDYGMY